ncbi:putative quinol monooxygenase [Paenibacillus sacheonensis]|uniref:Antibiotic biosynthesis monooxygenase n=1 Tax=Paenibacillus sacheonensis TaxID=742054 RepID=A0A7X4YP82_9BACL|nr:putative quinol monooxygenase [Paenibacillus sacheonensis]MBM7565227.1 quinol monooxygenase YgiN [Paenibacillus sacheonensis]NBC69997.1 antibiotic biosynthesis monooxygenase [Paenibacillus sacheonensis]
MAKFGLSGKMMAQPGKRDELATLLLEATAAMKDVKDCQVYIVSVLPEEPDAIWITEVWSSAEAHQASLALDTTRAMIQRAKPLIAGFEQQIRHVPLGGIGVTP